MPFLNEEEWHQISPLLRDAVLEIQKYRADHDCDLFIAKKDVKPEAMKKFEELTGMPGVDFERIYHHRLIDWGAECDKCGYLLRTPKASYCANCWQAFVGKS